MTSAATRYEICTARLILRSLLRGQTLRGLTQQDNPTKNPATLEEPRKVGQRLTLLRKEIWAQGCEKSDASKVRFESHLASHSPVAKSPYRVAKTHRIPYLYRSYSAKEPYI